MDMKFFIADTEEQNRLDPFSWKGPTTIIWPNYLTTSGLTKS